MINRSLEATGDFIRSLGKAREPSNVRAELHRYVARYGATHFFAGLAPRPGLSRRDALAHVLLDAWPPEWTDRYFSEGYVDQDPAVKMVRERRAPFLWSEIDPFYLASPLARKIMDEASQYGLKQGFTMALPTLDTGTIGFSVAGDRLDISPEDRNTIIFIASYAVGHLLLLGRRTSNVLTEATTARELEAMQWIADGRDTAEIASKMDITCHGVDYLLREGRRKFGATSTVHAVAEAFRLGLLK